MLSNLIKLCKYNVKCINNFKYINNKFLSTTSNDSWLRDITGNIVYTTNKETIILLDEAIMNMITMEDHAFVQLRNIIENDNKCSFAYPLLAFEILRNTPINSLPFNKNIKNIPEFNKYSNSKLSSNEELQMCLNYIENNIENDNISNREKYFSAAALAWSKGNYSKSGSLLECSIIENPQDTIALKLAQDSYLAAGDSKNVLGCIARCIHVFDDRHYLHGHLLGMLTAGYLEVGRLSDAEEVGNRAVSSTIGRDAWALHSLLNTFQMLGRSSEAISMLENYLSKHEGSGQIKLLYNKGSANIQRGNYTGALNQYDRMMDYIIHQPQPLASSLHDATLLLWNISINKMNGDIYQRWVDPFLVNAWHAVCNNGIITGNNHHNLPIYDLCASMVYAVGRKGMDISDLIDDSNNIEIPDVPQGDRGVFDKIEDKHNEIWRWLQGISLSS
jgi:hypothetical protein